RRQVSPPRPRPAGARREISPCWEGNTGCWDARLMIRIDPHAPPGRPPPRHLLRSWLPHTAVCLSLAAGCGAEDTPLDEISQEITAPGLSSLVTNVGVAKGRLAVQFNGAWFALESDPMAGWAVENGAAATAVAATPVDTS